MRLSGPPALVQAIPYLVGFAPHDSVVVVALAGGRSRVVLTVRVDIDHDSVSALERVWPTAAEQGAHGVVIAVYDSQVDGPPLARRPLVDALVAAAREHGLTVVDALAVGARRFWSYVCENPDCCPSEGRSVDQHGPVAAAMVVNGLSRVPRREDLVAEVEPDQARAGRVAVAVERLPQPVGSLAARRAAGVELLDSLVRQPQLVASDDASAAAALVALTDLWVRDSQLVPRRGRDGDRAGRVWSALSRSAPTQLRAAPLVLLALQRFREGQGARANIALDAAMADQPDYAMAHLLQSAIAGALPPSEIDRALREAVRSVRRSIRGQIRPSRSGGSRAD